MASGRLMTKIAGSGSISQRHDSADPDPHQNLMDPAHCSSVYISEIKCHFIWSSSVKSSTKMSLCKGLNKKGPSCLSVGKNQGVRMAPIALFSPTQMLHKRSGFFSFVETKTLLVFVHSRRGNYVQLWLVAAYGNSLAYRGRLPHCCQKKPKISIKYGHNVSYPLLFLARSTKLFYFIFLRR